MSQVSIIFPHQLFKEHPALQKGTKIFLVEEFLFQ
jgi:deoxyribodipyrimidine photolyase-related protein